MLTEESEHEEPALPILLERRRFLLSFLPPAVVALACGGTLLATGNILLPFASGNTLTGEVGSEKVAFFQDAQVVRTLIAHRIKVNVVPSGSRDIASHDMSTYDFVLPSGLPSATAIEDSEQGINDFFLVYRPFVSPIVLATYRPYAQALVRAGAATPQRSGSSQALYYDLDLTKFLALISAGHTWHDIDPSVGGAAGGYHILAQTSDVCSSNSADTYLALVAFVSNGGAVVNQPDRASALADAIKPLLTAQGLPDNSTADRFQFYLGPYGSGQAPIIVAYEHQYLAYQAQQAGMGKPDPTRVLLYPRPGILTEPAFIALSEEASTLGQLLVNDPGLQRRAVALGYRVLGNALASDQQLPAYLRQLGLPVPADNGSGPGTAWPDRALLDQMINAVGDCG